MATEQMQLADPTPAELAELERLYADFAAAHMAPLWTQRGGLMPTAPGHVVVEVAQEQRDGESEPDG